MDEAENIGNSSRRKSNENDENYVKYVIDKPPEISLSSIHHDASSLNEYALGLPGAAGEDEINEPPGEDNESFGEEEKSNECFIPVVKETQHYFERRRINDFLQFMMNHLLVNEPEDPVMYLTQLVDRCLMFRSGMLETPPLLFEDKHLASLYSSFDPLNTGSISMKQYCIGMATLGLNNKEFDKHPETLKDGTVAKNTFIGNAKMALVEKLMDMIMLPPPYSDGNTSSIETFLH